MVCAYSSVSAIPRVYEITNEIEHTVEFMAGRGWIMSYRRW